MSIHHSGGSFWSLSLHRINRQLASLSAKVQAYEDVIKKLSNRFGVSDEQLMSIALAVGNYFPPASFFFFFFLANRSRNLHTV